MAYTITQHRRGTYEEWLDVDFAPADGELIIVEFDANVCKCKIGDGETSFSELPYITDWLAEEFISKLNALQELTGTELTAAQTELYQRISELSSAFDTELTELKTDLEKYVTKLDSSVEALSVGLDRVDGVVKTLVEPAVGALDAKYSEELSRMSDRHAKDITQLNSLLATKTAELAKTFDAAINASNSKVKASLASTETSLTADYTYKIIEAEDHLRANISVVEQTLRQQAKLINQLQNDLMGAASDVNNLVDDKIVDSETRLSARIAEILEEIQQINTKISDLPEESASLRTTAVRSANASGSMNLPTLVEQLEDLQYKVELLDNDASITSVEMTKIKAELAQLATALSNISTIQKSNYAALLGALNSLESRLTKSDADINLVLSAHVSVVNEEITKLKAADTKLYTVMYGIKDKLIKKIDATDTALHTEFSDAVSKLTQALADAEIRLDTQIAQTRAELTDNLTATKADLAKKLEGLNTIIDNRVNSNEAALVELHATVATTLADTRNELDALNADVLSNKTNITSVRATVSQVATALDTKTDLISTNLENLSTRVNNQVAEAEERLHAKVDIVDRHIHDQEQTLSDVKNDVNDLVTSLDKKIADKVLANRNDVDTSILEIREDIHQINLKLIRLGSGSGNTSSIPGSNEDILALAEQLASLQTKLHSLEGAVLTTSNSGQQLAVELAGLSTSLTNLIDTQKANNATVTNAINMLDARLSKANADLSTATTTSIEVIKDELTDLAADDVILYQVIYRIRDELLEDIDKIKSGLLDNEIASMNQSVKEAKETIAVGLAEAKTYTQESVTAAKTTLSKDIANLEERHGTKISATEKALADLGVTVKSNQVDLTAAVGALDTALADSNVNIAANSTAIRQVNSDLDTKTTLINTGLNILDTRLDAQEQRISGILALDQGSTTGDAELMDARIGYDGITHTVAGDAIRAVGNDLLELKNSLPDYIPDNAVDGLYYENNKLYLTSNGETVGEPVTITGGSGGGTGGSVVKITNNLASNTFTVSQGSKVSISFTYTSFEEGVPTGDGSCTISINNKVISTLTGIIKHGIAKVVDITEHLHAGSNSIKVTCTDQYGVSKSLVYTISLIELKITATTFNSAEIFEDAITFRYKVFGQIEKIAHILIDDVEVSGNTLSASVNNKELTYVIPKQPHGCHKLTAYLTAEVDGIETRSNTLEYELVCIENNNNAAILASSYQVDKVTQGDLVSIPFMVYDPDFISVPVTQTILSKVGGELITISTTSVNADRSQQYWNTRNYPAGTTLFELSYTYDHYGEQKTIKKVHTLTVSELDIDVAPETDSLQLALSSVGRSNNETNPGVWSFTPALTGSDYTEVSTTFDKFNWKSNGWIVDSNGDTCLRLNGDARATINFKPFYKDFKTSGKTIEFEFLVRDVNNRNAVVINCHDGSRGFKATPDTALLQSSGTKVSCRYKDNEKVRVAVTVEHASTLSRFVSIYLDGVLSGVQRYTESDIFSQNNATNIVLGSNYCGLDVYSIRVYNKALSAADILANYIADTAQTSEKLQLAADNNLLDENDKLSYEAVKAQGKIPIITFTGDMPKYKGDKRKDVRMKFEDPANPELDFDVLLDQIDVQGTSSQFYVRKNWKVKLPEARPHMPGAIPAKVYCIKVDYAEATGTHNTGTANYVETFYDRNEAILPPQKDDDRVRTTVQGFPCIIFEKATEDSEPVFSSKANFNYDKDAEAVFGFTEDYDSFGVECWEFCNNTSASCNFTGEVPSDWSSDFEPRYAPKSARFDDIEDLLEIKDLAAKGEATFTKDQQEELTSLQNACITNFKKMHDWVLSTATYELTFDENGKVTGTQPITPKALDTAITYGDVTYTEDNEAYRLAKFKHEFKDYFNLHYSCIYYVFTFFALMTDQRAKNMFLTRWKDDDGIHRWYPYFYDNDTIFGINNEGALVFDYYHEDIDKLGSSNIYNGQNSVLWNNFRQCFAAEIKNTYSTLRSSKKLTYDAIIDQYVTKGSDMWSAVVYNEDAEYKYVSMARELQTEGDYAGKVDDSNLYQVRGPGEHHLRYFIANRLNYCDSKWYAGNYPDDYLFCRIYTPTTVIPLDTTLSEQELIETYGVEEVRIYKSLKAVPANPNITVTPFSDMYAGVKYKANGVLQQARVKSGQTYTFEPPTPETFNDTETAIYGAGELSSLGDLSGLYCGVISLGKASKLVELKLGNENPDYYNDNFREVRVGSNRLLKSIDLRNCAGLGLASGTSIDEEGAVNNSTTQAPPQTVLDLSGCPNIESIYAEGTHLQSISLPEGGYIRTLHLPATTNTLVIKNHKYISDFAIESYKNLKTLCLEDCPTLDTTGILTSCKNDAGEYTVERVRMTGIEWGTKEAPLENVDFIKSLFPRYDDQGNLIGGIRGIDANYNPLDDAYLVGTCYITSLTGAEYTEIKSHYPYLEIQFGEMTSNVIFNYTDAEGAAHVEAVSLTNKNSQLGDASDYVTASVPAWPENDAFIYEFIGWSRNEQISKGVNDSEEDYLLYIQADALTGIAGDRNLYPIFKALRKSYNVHFLNPSQSGDILLQTVSTPYGSDAKYSGATPVKQDTTTASLYSHTGWYPSPEKITGETYCVAQFTVLDSTWYTLTVTDIDGGYSLNTGNNTMSITKCNNKYNKAVRVPETFSVSGGTYYVATLGGFSGHDKLVLIDLPDSLDSISASGFSNCYSLTEVVLPTTLTTLGTSAFSGCAKLSEIYIPANLTSIGESAFGGCSKLSIIEVSSENPRYYVQNGCLIERDTGLLLQGLATAVVPQDGSVTKLGKYCFSKIGIQSIDIPDTITTIPSNAFSYCGNLSNVTLPASLRTLDATCFAWCSALKNITLPEGLLNINTYVFNSCSLETIKIPSTVEQILENAFGGMSSLQTVTFKKRVDADGNVIVPTIHYNAFANSGPIVFNVPWSEQQHNDSFSGTYTSGGVTYDKSLVFGAKTGSILNFDYEEE